MSSFELGGLRVHVRGYEQPDDPDYWDGNWLWVEATLVASGSRVEASGSFLRADELERFAIELEALRNSLVGRASLDSLEPTLKALAEGDGLGHIHLTIELTPDHLLQAHKVQTTVDQTYLQPALKGLHAILDLFPVRGSRP